MFPSGWVGMQERDLLLITTGLMLLVCVPVIFMALYFPWKYREQRTDKSDYAPEFAHSNKIELVVWGGPIVVIAIIAAFTGVYTYKLDPYAPIESANKPIEVQAVAMDWKWLFIYPEEGIATVNRLEVPEGHPINLTLTSSTVMSTFSVPALGGMVYAMPTMETQLHLIADKTGTYRGSAAHYAGPGFAGMEFDTVAVDETDFDQWVAAAKADGNQLDRAEYLALEVPSQNNPQHVYGSVADGLFHAIVGLCVEEETGCIDEMMAIDAAGGGGLEGINQKSRFEYDSKHAIDGFGQRLIKVPIDEHKQKPKTESDEEPDLLSSLTDGAANQTKM